MNYKAIFRNTDNNYKHDPNESKKIVKEITKNSDFQKVAIELSKE